MSTFESFNWFQVLLLAGVGLVFVACVAGMARRWITLREGGVGVLVCLAAASATIRPDLTVRMANALGIGRGADLIFYCAVVAMLIGFWMTYIRLRHLRREITLLVRRLAIMEAERGGGTSQDRPRRDAGRSG